METFVPLVLQGYIDPCPEVVNKNKVCHRPSCPVGWDVQIEDWIHHSGNEKPFYALGFVTNEVTMKLKNLSSPTSAVTFKLIS